MAASGGLAAAESQREDVLQWLRNLPLAPEYHPTLSEFQDPIAYIFKIEKEASKYGICKIVPPVLQSPKKTAIANLNRSLAARVGASSSPPTFTTRQQQIGFCPRRPRPVQKPVWQSGENYTFQEFESKAKSFEKTYFKKYAKKGTTLSPLEIETLYWKATVDKPFSVEYANDMPGSAFSVRKNSGMVVEGMSVGETEWNMRGVARAKGSLLRHMKEEIPGVTSPMLYIAMMFSWFAWHVEDHDLHSLNYMHMGAGKTWYGVPKEAAVAFEEVVRVHGYGGEINPLLTFAVLGEKTTVMSPEVFIRAGVPCCRLVQNAGEFVVTFPRAYHSGFSHGFNCGEASNIATPEWLRVAKEAAVRRASINYPPMVSHFQLLYDLASELCSRLTANSSAKPRSSRLKDKQKGEAEMVTKEILVENVMHNNDLLYNLGKGTSVVLLPRSSSDISLCSNYRFGSQFVKPSFGLRAHKGFIEASKVSGYDDSKPDRIDVINQVKGMYPLKAKFGSSYEGNTLPMLNKSRNLHEPHSETEGMVMLENKSQDHRLFSCVTCGILNYDCVAIIKPREAAAKYFMSADCSFFNDWTVVSGVGKEAFVAAEADTGGAQDIIACGPSDVLESENDQKQMIDRSSGAVSGATLKKETSALGLLALNYGDSSDSDEEQGASPYNDTHDRMNSLSEGNLQSQDSASPYFEDELPGGTTSDNTSPRHKFDRGNRVFLQDVENNVQKLENTIPLLAPTCDEDSSRMHVFCLEHAVEVEQRLRQIGGVHVFLLCHPDYPGVEEQAKLVSEELRVDYLWKETSFRAASIDDEQRIQSVLDSEEAIPGNSDWAVKLGINLFYSANLSWSPLYTKQMAYNSVIYNAFGRTSPGSSPKKSNVSGRRQRKAVVGKWCGKVWMSNQVHPFLANWDSHYQDQEHEPERTSLGWAQSTVEKLDVQQHIFQTETARKSLKSGKKRKPKAKSASVKKVVAVETEEVASDDLQGVSQKPFRRLNSWNRTEGLQREVSDNSVDEHEILHRMKLARTAVNEYVESDDSLGDESLRQYKKTRNQQTRDFDCERAEFYDTVRNTSQKQRRTPRVSQTYVQKELASDDSFEENILQWHGRVPRSKQMKLIEREQEVSELPIEESSPKSHKVYKRRKGKCANKEDAAPSELTENVYHRQNSLNSKGNQFEEAEFDDSLEGSVKWQTASFSRDDIMSDDSVYNDAHQQRGDVRGKNPLCDSAEDAVSDDPLDEDAQQLDRTFPITKRSRSFGHEEAVSDDSLEDDIERNFRSIHQNKRAKFAERQEDITDDLRNKSTRRHPRKTPRGKHGRFIKGEMKDADSDHMIAEEFDEQQEQQGRTLRSKQKKPVTLSQMQRGQTPQSGKGWKKPMMKETPRSVKQQRTVKLETPRMRNNKCVQNTYQLDDVRVPDDDEGGPSSRLRRRPSKAAKVSVTKSKEMQQQSSRIKVKSAPAGKAPAGRKGGKIKEEEGQFQCDIEGCTMSFSSKQELNIHKRNICPVKGCGKVFFSHKYLVQHRRVHVDDRPLKCPWKGCKMSFKWAWARTEHIRVHTGARPYVCAEEGCGQTFRFVSDFSRHKRKTGHSGRKDSE
ncbi:Lysine-specific demethylase REF6 [Linum perenne]